MLQAAWAADDAADSIHAARWRAEAAFLWGEPADVETALRRIDVLRRAGEFGAASAAADRLGDRGLDETSSAVLAFQRARIAARDIGRHLISSAVRPPAHRPHVTSHGRVRRLAGCWDGCLAADRQRALSQLWRIQDVSNLGGFQPGKHVNGFVISSTPGSSRPWCTIAFRA